MGKLLGELINRHELCITTELSYPFKRSNNTGKSTIDLTFIRSLKNLQVKIKKFELIKSGHVAIDVLREYTQNNIKHQPKFKTKNANLNNWQKHLIPHLNNYTDNFQMLSQRTKQKS